MAELLMTPPLTATPPDISHLITEDDTPVESFFVEKQQRLLTGPLYSSWAGPGDGRPFVAAANVGVFAQARNPAIVPDVFVSLDVETAKDLWAKEHRSYLLWEFGKPPDVVVEVVSNTIGKEDDEKKRSYARMRVSYYVIYDPQLRIMSEVLTIYSLQGSGYARQHSRQFPALNLGVTLWDGIFEEQQATWLRWTDADGTLILTGNEMAEHAEARLADERQHAEAQLADERQHAATQLANERQRAEAQLADERQRAATQLAEERQRAEVERQRAERLAALLRQAGLDPEQP